MVQGGSDPAAAAAAAAFSFQATCTQFRSDVPFISAVVPLEHCIISIFGGGAEMKKICDVLSKQRSVKMSTVLFTSYRASKLLWSRGRSKKVRFFSTFP